MSKIIAIDIGGTFTDLVALDEDSEKIVYNKVPTDPARVTSSILAGLRKLGVDLREASRIIYSSTVGTNAILEGKGAKCGLITTKGFRDVYDIGRLSKEEMFNEFYQKHKVLIPRYLRLEIDERINPKGEITKKINKKEVAAVSKKLVAEGVESIAVCLLNSYVNSIHEKIVGEIIEKNFPEIFVSLSTKIANQCFEFERTSTTVINAYVGPVMKKHLDELDSVFSEMGFKGKLFVMQANGSVASYTDVAKKVIYTLNSGPCAGVVGQAERSKLSNIERLITTDMGGTSFDVGVIIGHEPTTSMTFRIFKHPVLVPAVDIKTIGAGGGSIAWVDEGGALNVGPMSAGAYPGPACYGRGGENPTVTDANVVLNRIDPDFFLGGEIKLYPERATKAIREKVSTYFNEDPLESALNIVRIIDSKMAYAIRSVTIEKGLDPKEFVLVSYGGAGPIHASAIADELGCSKISIPYAPANLCALELIRTDIRHDFVCACFTRLDDDSSYNQIDSIFEDLIMEAEDLFVNENVSPKDRLFVKGFDMRYVDQYYTFTIKGFNKEQNFSSKSAKVLRDKFNSTHEREYGYLLNDPIEITNLRVFAFGRLPKVDIRIPKPKGSLEEAIKEKRNVVVSSGEVECTVYDRMKLPLGVEIKGPAIIEEVSSNTLLSPNDIATINDYGDIIIEKRRDQK